MPPSAAEPPAASGPDAAPAKGQDARPDAAAKTATATDAGGRSGKQPSAGQITETLLKAGISKAKLLGRPAAVGDGRFVGMAIGGEPRPRPWVYVVSDKAGAAHLEHHLLVKAPYHEYYRYSSEGPIEQVASHKVHDFDNDSEAEAMMLFRYRANMPALGELNFGLYLIFDLDPSLSVAFNELTQMYNGMHQWRKARVRFRDTNGDGHLDINVMYNEYIWCGMGEDETPPCREVKSTFVWDAATDRWQGKALPQVLSNPFDPPTY